MSKHTPGPWILKGLTVYNSNEIEICESNDFVRANADNTSEIEANARLIAAAPDMMDALKDCLAYMLDDQSSDVTGAKALDSINAAIAKAEGTWTP